MHCLLYSAPLVSLLSRSPCFRPPVVGFLCRHAWRRGDVAGMLACPGHVVSRGGCVLSRGSPVLM